MKAAFVFLGGIVLAAGLWFSGLLAPSASGMLITNVTANPTMDGDIAATLTIENQGPPDVLLSVNSTVAEASIEKASMGLPVQSGTSSLALDAAYIRLRPSDTALEDGTLVPLTLRFADAGDVSVKARYTAADMDASAHHMAMGHAMVNVDAQDGPVPRIQLSVSPDETGWRAQITTENFVFSEAQQDAPHVPGMGHGHIYLGGMKLGRLFGESYEIGQLPKGKHILRVTLNTNNHRAYMSNGQPLGAEAVIVVD